MTIRRSATQSVALMATLVAMVALAACGGGNPTSAPTPTVPTNLGQPSDAVPTFDLGTAFIPSFALPSFAGDEELEALLPDSVGGQVVAKQSIAGEAILNSGFGGAAALEETLTEVGATIDDVSVAIGTAGDSLIILAYQVDGVSADRIFEGLLEPLASGGGGNVTEIEVGGRSVTTVVAGGETTYIYLAGDVVFIIGGTVTGALLADAVAQLPAD